MMRMILDRTDIKKDPIYNTFFSMLRQLIIMSEPSYMVTPLKNNASKKLYEPLKMSLRTVSIGKDKRIIFGLQQKE